VKKILSEKLTISNKKSINGRRKLKVGINGNDH
jgi:hypothetical protein